MEGPQRAAHRAIMTGELILKSGNIRWSTYLLVKRGLFLVKSAKWHNVCQYVCLSGRNKVSTLINKIFS